MPYVLLLIWSNFVTARKDSKDDTDSEKMPSQDLFNQTVK